MMDQIFAWIPYDIFRNRETEEPVNEGEKNVGYEKQSGQEDVGDANKESSANEQEEKEPDERVLLSFLILLCSLWLYLAVVQRHLCTFL